MISPFQVELARAINDLGTVEYHCFFTVKESANRGKHWLADQSREGYIHTSADWADMDELADWTERELREIQPDIIVRNGILRSISWAATQRIRDRFPGVPFGSWLEHPDFSTGPVGKRLATEVMARRQLRDVPFIMAIGDKAQRYYQRIAPHADVSMVPYGQDLTPVFAIERPEAAPQMPTFLFSGQLVGRNNIPGIVAAFDKLAQTHPGQFRFVNAGVGPLDSLVQGLMSRSRVFADCITFDRYYDTWDERLRPFRDSNVLLAPYHHAGWCFVVPEAMASGMPVIATRNVAAARYFLRHEVNGLVCQTDSDDIHRAMVRFVEDPQAIHRMGTAARESAREGDVTYIAERWVEACLRVLGR